MFRWKQSIVPVLCVLLSRCISVQLQAFSECKVMVSEPWPVPVLFVPQDAYVLINCSSDSSSPPIWSIDLANDSSSVQLQFATRKDQLNSRGFYNIEIPGIPLTSTLLINETANNNGTVIFCTREEALHIIFSVLEPVQLTLRIAEIKLGSINIMWHNHRSETILMQTFSLIISYGSVSQVIQLNESYYHFTAPEDPPPCQVYNFSVTTTYIGATYTGAGCSVPSQVISTMLPSLTDVDQVQSSLSYLLTKQPNGSLALQILLTLPTSCRTYYVYTLVITLNETESYQQQFTSSESSIIANVTSDYLQDNALLSFKVLIGNTFNDTFYKTSVTKLYTTDVQNITVAENDNGSVPGMVLVQCDFIPGSDAQGCMVVLVGESDNTTVNLTRPGTLLTACTIQRLPITTTIINVFGYDIEFDGSVGTQQVPGTSSVISLTDSYLHCQPNEAISFPFLNTCWIIVIASLAAAGCAVLTFSLHVLLGATVLRWHSKKSSAHASAHAAAVNRYVTDDEVMSGGQPEDTMPYYDQPENVHPMRKRSFLNQGTATSDETEYSKTSHTLQCSPTVSCESEGTTYSRLQDSQEHMYHVLEGATYSETITYTCQDSRADSQPSNRCNPTIQDEGPVEEQLYAQVPSSPSQIARSQELGSIYQHLDDLSMYTNNGIMAIHGSPLTDQDSTLSSTIVRTIV